MTNLPDCYRCGRQPCECDATLYYGDVLDICCPDCGYSPLNEPRYILQDCKTMAESAKRFTPFLEPKEPLDYFEVCGADEGNVICPVCSFEFRPLSETNRLCQGKLF